MLSSGGYLIPVDYALSAVFFIHFCNKNRCLLIAIKKFLMTCKLLARVLTVFGDVYF